MTHTQGSILLVASESAFARLIDYKCLDAPALAAFDLPGVVSRKLQLIPYLSRLVKSY